MKCRQAVLPAGNEWSLDELLNAPLPEHPAARRSISVSHKDKDRCTHPTFVQHWVHWEKDVKNRLQEADIAVRCPCLAIPPISELLY